MEIHAKNEYREVVVEGLACIEFITGGKYQKPVLVDKRTWDEYLHTHHWTAIKDGNYITAKTSINKQSVSLHRVIIEHEYCELDYWGNVIDHKNNDPLDNRLVNLKIRNGKLNPTNVKSKYKINNMHLIYPQPRGGYKVHTNVNGQTIYRHFAIKEKAQAFRDMQALPSKDVKIIEMEKKARDIEFERGLRDKLRKDEKDEVLEILRKYGIVE